MKLQATLFIATCCLHYVQSASLGAAVEVPRLEDAVLEEEALEAPQLESNTQEYQAVENPKADETDESESGEDEAADEQSNAEGRYGSMITGHGFIGSMHDWNRSKGSMSNGHGSYGSINDWNRSKGSMNSGIGFPGSTNNWRRSEGSMNSGIGSPGSMNGWHRFEGSMNSEIGSPVSINGWLRFGGSMNSGIGFPGSMNGLDRFEGTMNNRIDFPGSINHWHRSEDSMDHSYSRDSTREELVCGALGLGGTQCVTKVFSCINVGEAIALLGTTSIVHDCTTTEGFNVDLRVENERKSLDKVLASKGATQGQIKAVGTCGLEKAIQLIINEPRLGVELLEAIKTC